jgi:hypothetical protein
MALTSTPPIKLIDIQNEFSANSLNGARINAGFSSPVSILNFLGASAAPTPITESQSLTPSSVFGLGWSWAGGSARAETNLNDTPVGAVEFFFSSNSPGHSNIPSGATINSITMSFSHGVPATSVTGSLADADVYFIDNPTLFAGLGSAATFFTSFSFQRLVAGVIFGVTTVTFGVNDYTVALARTNQGLSGSEAFIQMWNSGNGEPSLLVSGTDGVFSDIIRNGNYRLLCGATLSVNYTYFE